MKDKARYDKICQELQLPPELAVHIWEVHPPPENLTDEELKDGIAELALGHTVASALAGKPDGLAA